MRDGPACRAASRREIARLSRLATLDKALVLILVPLWMACFALGVKSQIEGRSLVDLGSYRGCQPVPMCAS
jgi:hypothetical protein